MLDDRDLGAAADLDDDAGLRDDLRRSARDEHEPQLAADPCAVGHAEPVTRLSVCRVESREWMSRRRNPRSAGRVGPEPIVLEAADLDAGSGAQRAELGS